MPWWCYDDGACSIFDLTRNRLHCGGLTVRMLGIAQPCECYETVALFGTENIVLCEECVSSKSVIRLQTEPGNLSWHVVLLQRQ